MEMIVAIVERGFANVVLKAAAAAGASGGTVLSGRGAGEHTFSFFGNMEVDPGKEIVHILAAADQVEKLFGVVAKAAQTHIRGRGVAYTFPVGRFSGPETNEGN